MSATPNERLDGRFDVDLTPGRAARLLALLAAAGVLAAYLSVLWDVMTVVRGDQSLFAAVVVVALGTATLSARYVPLPVATTLGVGTLAAGVVAYGMAIPAPFFTAATLGNALGDFYVLVSGNLSLISIVAAETWAISMAPAPVYLVWYFALYRRYDAAAVAGGTALGFVVLTGDANAAPVLGGAVSLLAMLGVGSLESFDADWEQFQDLGLVLLATVILARLVRVVPASGISEGPTAGGGPLGGTSLEGGLLASGDTASILGSIKLSPTVRFEVVADRPALWHVGGYDRYTGSNWVQTGGTQRYRPERLSGPPGASETLDQTFTAQSDIATVPAAWRPTRFEDDPPVAVDVTSEGGFRTDGSMSEGDDYTVRSEVPRWNQSRLRNAGTDYPGDVTDRYLQVPGDLPDRVGRKARDVAGDAATPYDAAVAVSKWLQANKDYSLNVSKPNGDVVDSFLFHMSSGYCIYFATAMTVMLRTLDVPARFATGYTPGQQAGDGRWIIRGLNSHAWVEVYFPAVGWVPFDPTPSGPRQQARRRRIQRAREDGGSDATPTPTPTPSPTPTPDPTTPDESTADVETPPGSALQGGGASGRDDVEENISDLGATGTATPTAAPSDRVVAGGTGGAATTDGSLVEGSASRVGERDRLSLVLGAAGVLLGAYRFKVVERGVEQFQMRWQRRTDDPETDVIRAYDRLELLLSKQYRDRRENETARMYLRALDEHGLDERTRRVGDLYERAYYGGEVTDADADEAIELVDGLVADHARFP